VSIPCLECFDEPVQDVTKETKTKQDDNKKWNKYTSIVTASTSVFLLTMGEHQSRCRLA